PHARLR
ncbi:hypothetical protein CFOL_v3_00886, partial [Cephalotus follicularis]